MGLLASWWASRLVAGFLSEIDPHEPLVWAAATMTLLAVATVAAWLPARRAAKADPMVILRVE